ncbi:MAG: DUF2442 domain-containing protein, partial [Oscillospiraceae bacterium]|nr:DUF2442 domain-containing protein [Oscillospiraceae bacterium]
MNPKVRDVTPQDNHTLLVTFENGDIKHFDVKPYLQYPIFKPLIDTALFHSVIADG